MSSCGGFRERQGVIGRNRRASGGPIEKGGGGGGGGHTDGGSDSESAVKPRMSLKKMDTCAAASPSPQTHSPHTHNRLGRAAAFCLSIHFACTHVSTITDIACVFSARLRNPRAVSRSGRATEGGRRLSLQGLSLLYELHSLPSSGQMLILTSRIRTSIG